MIDKIIDKKYQIKRKIGAGSFGTIYEGEDTENKEKVAFKIESKKGNGPQLNYESKLYMLFSGGVNVPRLKYYSEDKKNNIMVMELMGKSLEDLHIECKERMSLKTVLMLADQMITSVEYLHTKNFIHRDIKPDNFVMGLGNKSNQVFIIDFGLCKKYRDPNTHEHIPFTDGKDLTGTARYASINSLKGCEVSRRDDMEALLYVWVYLLKGSLPWMGLDAKDKKAKYRRICETKEKTKPEDLCSGLPSEFARYLTLVKKLKFTEEPEYSVYRSMFRKLFLRMKYKYDYKYDWLVSDSPRKKIQSARVSPPHVKKITPKRRAKSPKNVVQGKSKSKLKQDSNITEKTSQTPQKKIVDVTALSDTPVKQKTKPKHERRKLKKTASEAKIKKNPVTSKKSIKKQKEQVF